MGDIIGVGHKLGGGGGDVELLTTYNSSPTVKQGYNASYINSELNILNNIFNTFLYSDISLTSYIQDYISDTMKGFIDATGHGTGLSTMTISGTTIRVTGNGSQGWQGNGIILTTPFYVGIGQAIEVVVSAASRRDINNNLFYLQVMSEYPKQYYTPVLTVVSKAGQAYTSGFTAKVALPDSLAGKYCYIGINLGVWYSGQWIEMTFDSIKIVKNT